MNPRAQSIHIERVDLDLRGVPPATAEAAVGALGPALNAALAQTPAFHPPGEAILAARDISAADLSRLIAQRLAAAIHREAAATAEIV